MLKSDGKIIIGDWGKAKSKFMRFTFYIVQMLDGFKITSDNVNGLMPEYMKKSGFKNVSEIDYINTKIGSYCYYTGVK